MFTAPSIYIVRKGREKDDMPESKELNDGDMVILPSGDVLVWSKKTWKLLPGRFLKIEELKQFVGYVGSGWPSSESEAREGLKGKVSDQFMERMVGVVNELSKHQEGFTGQETS